MIWYSMISKVVDFCACYHISLSVHVQCSCLSHGWWCHLGQLGSCTMQCRAYWRMRRKDAHGVEFHNVVEYVRPHVGQSILQGCYTRSCNIWAIGICAPSCVCKREESIWMRYEATYWGLASLLAYTILANQVSAQFPWLAAPLDLQHYKTWWGSHSPLMRQSCGCIIILARNML